MEDFSDQNIKNTTVSISIRKYSYGRQVGVTAAIPRCRTNANDKLWLFEAYNFLDTSAFGNLESLLVRLNPNEVIINDDLSSNSTMKLEVKVLTALMDSLSLTFNFVPKHYYATTDIEQDLPRILGVKSIVQYYAILSRGKELKESLASIAKHLDILSDNIDAPLGSFELVAGDISSMMKLDSSAIKALNLFPLSKHSAKYSSVFGLLNHCVTKKIGERLLNQWIRQPLVHKFKLEQRQCLVGLLFDNYELRESLRSDALKLVPDLSALSTRLQRQKYMKLQHLYIIFQFTSACLPALKQILNDGLSSEDLSLNNEENQAKELLIEKFIQPIESLIGDFQGFEALINKVLDFDAINRRPAEYLINSNWDSDLGEIAEQRDIAYNDIADLYDVASSTWGSDIDLKCEVHKSRGYVFRVTKKHDAFVRKRHGVTIVQVKNNGTIFVTDELSSLGSEYLMYQNKYLDAQKDLVLKAVNVAITYSPVIERAIQVIAELDVLASFAHVAANASIPYVCPSLSEYDPASAGGDTGGDIVLIESRHPVLELNDDMSFIANDVHLIRSKSRFCVVTGPNMGGKSTYIRQLGAIQVMAQIGSFVPCSKADVCIVDAILCRVGAGDSQSRGVSTFMSEMMDAANILHTATERSLVIVDELGRGTSTYDGFGLAWSISEYIINKIKCLCLFATHYHELTELERCLPVVKNLHVSAHTTDNSITMLYNVKAGPSDRSYGIHVAELAKFPPSVVSMARAKVEELEQLAIVASNQNTNVNNNNNKSMNKEALISQIAGNKDFLNLSRREKIDFLKSTISNNNA